MSPVLPSRRARRALRLTAVLAALFALVAAAGAARADTGGFGAFPALHRGQHREAPYFQLSLAPGHSASDAAVAVNSTDHTVRLGIAAVDGLTGQTSGAVFANNDAPRRRDALWVTPSVSVLTLAPHSRAFVRFRVSVPAGARSGDHLAGLALENLDHPHSRGRLRIIEVIRVVIGISVRVAGPHWSAVGLGAVRAARLGGTQYGALYVPIENAGLVYCRPTLAVRLQGPGRATTITRHLDTLLPGDRIAFPLAWPQPLRPGRYRASLTAAGCGRTAHAANSLRVGAAMPSAAQRGGRVISVAPAAARSGGGIPWFALLFVGVAGVLIGVLLSRRRREREEPPALPPLPVAGREKDDGGDEEHYRDAA